jgi:vacuolar-type H+-ATPase subunit D/Vma8
MKIIDGIINILQVVLPFLKKKDAKQVQEFTDLVKNQFDYLMEQITKFETDYFELSEKVRQMYQEMITLNAQLNAALRGQCLATACKDRQ